MSWSKPFYRLRTGTVRTRLTCWYAGAFAAFAIVLFLAEDTVLRRWLRLRRDDDLMASVRQYEALYIEFGLQTLRDEFRRHAQAEGIQNVFLRFLSPNRKILARSDLSAWNRLDTAALQSASLNPGHARFYTVAEPSGGPGLRLVEARLADGNYLHVGSSLHPDVELLNRYRTVFFWVCMAMLAFGTLLGWFLTGRAMAGVNRVRNAADAIDKADIGLRVEPPAGGTEIVRLAASFNRMLDRISDSVRAIRDVTDNLAHDLKSPVTRMRGAAETRLTSPHADTETQDLAAAVIEECDGLVEMMIRHDWTLAKEDRVLAEHRAANAGASRLQPDRFDLTDLVRNAHELFRPVAEEKNLTFTVRCPDSPLSIRADRSRLQRAVANLVDNAVKYTPAGGRVVLSAERQSTQTTVTVEDTGSGIPPEDLERIFERFYRIDDSRSTGGHGLGLALVRAVAQAHGGTVSVHPSPHGGSRFRLSLPDAADCPASRKT